MKNKLEKLEDENAKLRADLLKFSEIEAFAGCESCGARLFADDDIVSDESGDCWGCWAGMTDDPAASQHPCYAYRAGLPDARVRTTGDA